VREIAFVLNAVHGLKLVRTFDADVSVELHTDLADDVDASYRCGKRFHAICPERFIVKVPLTPAGVLAARRLVQDGIRINFTLGFAARQNYLIALVARPTWVNVFMGRINAFVADNKLGDGRNAGEKATLASQRVLRRLRKSPGIDVRQIGASMRSGQQCFDLLGLDVFTMPTAAAQEFLASNPSAGEVRDRTNADPPVTFATGVDAAADRLDSFWSVSPGFEQAMCKLLAADPVPPATLAAFLAEHGATCSRLRQRAPGAGEGGKIRLTRPGATRFARAAGWGWHPDGGGAGQLRQDQLALDDAQAAAAGRCRGRPRPAVISARPTARLRQLRRARAALPSRRRYWRAGSPRRPDVASVGQNWTSVIPARNNSAERRRRSSTCRRGGGTSIPPRTGRRPGRRRCRRPGARHARLRDCARCRARAAPRRHRASHR
jgi:hypothetical protein